MLESKEIHKENELSTSFKIEAYFHAFHKEVADRLKSLIRSEVTSLNLQIRINILLRRVYL